MPAAGSARQTAPGLSRREFLLALAGAVLASPFAPAASAAPGLLNKKAPDFALKDLDGRQLSLACFRGKVVLLDFWATWCAPCQVEMPVFAAWQRQYGAQGFQAVGISMDDEASSARRVVQRLKLNYPVAVGDERIGRLYGGVLGLPLTFLIDRRGVIRARFQGETDLKVVEKQWKALLAQPPAQ